MNQNLAQLSAIARKAVSSKAWRTVDSCAKEILRHDSLCAEGYFLSGLVSKASGQRAKAVELLRKRSIWMPTVTMPLSSWQISIVLTVVTPTRQHSRARYEDKLNNSPLYLNWLGLYIRISECPKGPGVYFKRQMSCSRVSIGFRLTSQPALCISGKSRRRSTY